MKRRAAARALVLGSKRGFQRTSGFYGRFTGPNAELKFHDLDIDDTVVAQAGSIAEDSCNAIAQGVTESQRIGRKCTIRSIAWRFDLQIPNVDQSTASAEVIRVILYLDKQCNGATAAVTGILESADYQSFNNLANKSRFRTLMDRTYSLKHQAGAWDGTGTDWSQDIMNDSFFAKCNIPIEFDADTGAITEIRSNNIGVLLISRAGVGSFLSKMRIRYSDV